MTWPESPRRLPIPETVWRWLLTALVLLAPDPAFSADEERPQAWLLTYGPGEIYWQRFGHNAVWIRDPARGVDHTFNFGFFDFAQEGFLRNFLFGRLNYFAAARPAEVELAEYIDENRSIRAQRLDLEPQQLDRLTHHLLDSVSEENREYLYDYYMHNCSTRVRDALDIALGGALREALEPAPAPLNFRDHTRRLTGMDYWLYLGLETGLGSPVDRPIDRWEEGFIPGVLARAIEGLENPRTGNALVVEDVMLYDSTLPPPLDAPRTLWHRYLLIPALLLIAAFVAVRATPRLAPRHLAIGWLLLAGVLGAVLAFLWLYTDHWVARLNLNLLLLNPLWLLIAAVPALHRPGAWFMVACGLLALAAPWLPPGQYNTDVAAFVLPLNVAAAIVLMRRRSAAKLGE